MKANGCWAWWNHFGDVPLAKCVERANQVAGVITKANYWDAFDAFKAAGVRIGIERYVYPDNPLQEARTLADGIHRGAEFAVINAEAEWEHLDMGPMTQLITELQRLAPGVEMYASVDVRGGRTALPFQRVLARHITAWMPEVYPKAFRPAMSPGAVQAAFRDSLDSGQEFAGKPILPTIQTYEDIGAAAVKDQVAESLRRGFTGCQAYTLAHATDAEWSAFLASVSKEGLTVDQYTELKNEIATLRDGTQKVTAEVGHSLGAIKSWIWTHAAQHGVEVPQDLEHRLTNLEDMVAKAAGPTR